MSSRSATRARQLRLNLDDLGFGEPADQIDVVHGEIDHHADIRHARRKRTDAGDGDRQDIFARIASLIASTVGIETLDMADHQGDAGMARRGNDVAALLHRRRDRLLDQNVHAALDAGKREVLMQVGGRRNGDSIDARCEQRARHRRMPGKPSAADTNSRCLRSGSATPTRLTPGRSASTRAWLLPMTPTPTTPTRNGPLRAAFGGLHHDGQVTPCRLSFASPP